MSNSLRHDEAIAEVERARTVGPLAPIMHTFAAMMYGWVDRYHAAFAAVRHAVTLDPDHFQGHVVLGHLHDRTGQADAALESYRTAHRVSGGNPLLLGFQGSVVGRTGRTDDARQLVATFEQIARSHHVPPCAFALV